MEKTKHNNTPSRILLMMYSGRLGSILSNISIILIVVGIFTVLSIVLNALLLILGYLFLIISLGSVLLFAPDYLDFLNSSSEFMGKFGEAMFNALPIIVPIAIVCAVLSIFFLGFDKTKSHASRIVFSAIVSVGSFVLLILILIGVGK